MDSRIWPRPSRSTDVFRPLCKHWAGIGPNSGIFGAIPTKSTMISVCRNFAPNFHAKCRLPFQRIRDADSGRRFKVVGPYKLQLELCSASPH